MRNQGTDIATSISIVDRASLAGIRRALRHRLHQVEADPALLFDCLVAVTEACTNALIHGTSDGTGEPAQISWQIDREEARFYIQDFSSQEWSMAAHPSGGIGQSNPEAEGRRVGGYGLSLMRQLMDEVTIEARSDGTTVTMAKRLA